MLFFFLLLFFLSFFLLEILSHALWKIVSGYSQSQGQGQGQGQGHHPQQYNKPGPPGPTTPHSQQAHHLPKAPPPQKYDPTMNLRKGLSLRHPSYGTPDFYPQKHLQKEDIMTEEMVRDGFKNRSLFQSVPLEFCTDEEQMINRFKSPQFIDKLGDLMSQVYEIKERQEVVPRPVPPFDPPRKKGGMEKREPWLTSLGEGESLLSLSRTLPHGVKEILPDGLMKRLMPFPRANWLVKVVGCDEQRIPTHADFPLRWTESLEKYLSEKIRELSTEAGEGKKNAVKVSNPLPPNTVHFLTSQSLRSRSSMCCGYANGNVTRSCWTNITFSHGLSRRLG